MITNAPPTNNFPAGITVIGGANVDTLTAAGQTSLAGSGGQLVTGAGHAFETHNSVQSTGAGAAALGANCPATTPGAPNYWISVLKGDGTTVGWIPVWV